MAKPDKAKNPVNLRKNPDRKNGKKWKRDKNKLGPNGQRLKGRCKPSGCTHFGYSMATLREKAARHGVTVGKLIDELRSKRLAGTSWSGAAA